MNQNSSCTCILGFSGSGKTTLVKHLTAQTGNSKTFVINSEKEYDSEANEEISWEEASDRSLEKCNLIFEDLIGLRNKDSKLIKKFVHFLLRRKRINLFLVAHEIHNTGLFSLMPCMDFIYLTTGPKNGKILKDLKRMIPFEPGEPTDFQSLRHHYLKIDVKSQMSEMLNSKFEKMREAHRSDLVSKRKEVAKIIECLPEPHIILQLFDLIFKNIDPALLEKDTLCVNLQPKNSSDKPRSVHIVDYLAAHRSEEKPKKDILRLKKYMDSKVVIPQILIRNKYMCSTNNE